MLPLKWPPIGGTHWARVGRLAQEVCCHGA